MANRPHGHSYSSPPAAPSTIQSYQAPASSHPRNTYASAPPSQYPMTQYPPPVQHVSPSSYRQPTYPPAAPPNANQQFGRYPASYLPQPYQPSSPYPPAPYSTYGTSQQPQGQYPPAPQTQGYPPPPGQYGAPPPGPPDPAQITYYRQQLQAAIQERNLHGFYPVNSPILDQIAARAPAQIDKLCAQWRIARELGADLVKLALYDIVLYIDDSGSMHFEENGERIKDLKLIMERVVSAAVLFDDDGISIRFMNNQNRLEEQPHFLNNIKSEQQVEQIMSRVQFSGLTPMGTSLRQKILDEAIGRARAGQLRKPMLIITVTDGQPAGEAQGAVMEAIKYASQEVTKLPRYGPGALAFQFAQVGNDARAQEFLRQLDNDRSVGHLIDCTSNYENESAEMARSNPPVQLTPELWLLKLLLGAIDSSYDSKDNKSVKGPAAQAMPYGGPSPSGYGSTPTGQYGAPQGQYGVPQPGQYGAPPPSQYGVPQNQSQYGYQPAGAPGYPPAPQGQQGYNAPAPPRY